MVLQTIQSFDDLMKVLAQEFITLKGQYSHIANEIVVIKQAIERIENGLAQLEKQPPPPPARSTAGDAPPAFKPIPVSSYKGEQSDGTCPRCGAPVTYRVSKKGNEYAVNSNGVFHSRTCSGRQH